MIQKCVVCRKREPRDGVTLEGGSEVVTLCSKCAVQQLAEFFNTSPRHQRAAWVNKLQEGLTHVEVGP